MPENGVFHALASALPHPPAETKVAPCRFAGSRRLGHCHIFERGRLPSAPQPRPQSQLRERRRRERCSGRLGSEGASGRGRPPPAPDDERTHGPSRAPLRPEVAHGMADRREGDKSWTILPLAFLDQARGVEGWGISPSSGIRAGYPLERAVFLEGLAEGPPRRPGGGR